jgi:hypothetical protein
MTALPEDAAAIRRVAQRRGRPREDHPCLASKTNVMMVAASEAQTTTASPKSSRWEEVSFMHHR